MWFVECFLGAFNLDQIFYGNKTATDYFKILLQEQTTALIGSRYDIYILFLELHVKKKNRMLN